MKIKTETQTGSIVSFNYDNEIAEITGLTTSFEPSQDGTPSMHTETGNMVSFDGIEETNIYDVKADINPVQDLHGYDKPWAGGNGKNKLPLTVSGIKAANTSGTWSGNSYTLNGVTFMIQTDADGNVLSVTANETASANAVLTLASNSDLSALAGKSLVLNGSTDGTSSTYGLQAYKWNGTNSSGAFNGDSVTFTPTSSFDSVRIVVFSGTTVSNQKFYPMLRLASETDASFEPYSNNCPISGWTECDVFRTKKNLIERIEKWNVNGSGEIISNSTYRCSVVSIKAGQTYTFSQGGLKRTIAVLAYFYDAPSIGSVSYNGSRLLGQDGTFTAPITGYAVIRRDADFDEMQVELGSTATDYEPYNGNTYTIDLNGTRYGGTIDVTSGVMNVTKAVLNLGTLDWRYDATDKFYVRGYSASSYGIDITGEMIMSQYYRASTKAIMKANNGTFYISETSFNIHDDNYSDATAFKQMLTDTNAQLVYELATPLTAQLTPTQIEALIGENNLWASTGAITVTYGEEYPIKGWDKIKVFVSPTEEEEDATVYESQFGSTAYSGTIDVTAGELTTDMGHIASYNGESIGEPWLSSLDPYVSGTTPSTGAEVVYTLDEPQTYDVPPQLIEALEGPNNIWSDTGEDVTVKWAHAPVLSEAVMLNGKYLELTIDGYSTLGTSGRRSLGRQLDTYSVGTADGETVKNSTFPSRKITVNYVIQTDTEEELTEAINQLANILNQKECDFIFRDEPDKYFSGYGLLDSEPKKYRHAVKGTWTIYCAYPFKRSVETTELVSTESAIVEDYAATFEFNYNGTLPARPILRAEFASTKSGGDYSEDGDCGFVAFVDPSKNIIQLGNPDIVDLDQYEQYANETLVNSAFDALTGWTASGITVGSIADQFWNNGAGQTQKYAKGTGALYRSVTGSVNFDFSMVHRLCVNGEGETGKFEALAKNGNDIVAGFRIEKTGNGTSGTVYYILNNKEVGKDVIDLSYYNTNFGYCKRDPVYVEIARYDPRYDPYWHVSPIKRIKDPFYSKITRQVQKGWSYTQSNLNSRINKNGKVVTFTIGTLAQRTFKSSDIEFSPATIVTFNLDGGFNTNAVRSAKFTKGAGTTFSNVPNVFTAGDIVEADCNSADVTMYRAGSIEGRLEPKYGALGNDWEQFVIRPGTNIIRAVWSNWVDTDYKPEIRIIFNEVYL